MTTVRECGCWDSSVTAHKHLCRYHEGAEATQEQIVKMLLELMLTKDVNCTIGLGAAIDAIERGEYEKASE